MSTSEQRVMIAHLNEISEKLRTIITILLDMDARSVRPLTTAPVRGCVCPAELAGGCGNQTCPRRPTAGVVFTGTLPQG